MASYEEVMSALENADKAGKTEDAQKLASIANTMRSQRQQSKVPESVSNPEKGLESGGPFKFLEDLGDIFGSGASEKLSKAGVKPEISAATGAAINTAIQAAPMLYGSTTAMAEKLLGSAKKAEGAIVSGTKGLYRTITGKDIPIAEEATRSATKKIAESGAKVVEKEAEHEILRKKALDSVRKKNEAIVSKMKSEEPQTLDVQGEHLKSLYTATTKAADSARKVEYQKILPEALEEAAKKEAMGKRVDVSSSVQPLEDLIVLAKGTPLEDKLHGLITAVAGEGKQSPRTFAQLETTSRLLKEVAYSGPLEGYGSLIKNAARKAARELDSALEVFSPKYGTAKQTYAKMSEPLESMNTRLGRAIHGTEGGIKEDAYAKIASQDLPSKIFAKKEGIELLTDALAGGKNASPQARIEAAKQVDGMVENWLLETLRGEKTAESALSKLQTPSMKATLTASPKSHSNVTERLKTQLGHERTSAALEKYSQEAAKRGIEQSKKAAGIRKDIEMGDSLIKQTDAISKRQALTSYMNAISRGRTAGAISPQQLDIANGLISRANTLEEKTRLAKKIASYLKIAGAIGAEETIRRSFF